MENAIVFANVTFASFCPIGRLCYIYLILDSKGRAGFFTITKFILMIFKHTFHIVKVFNSISFLSTDLCFQRFQKFSFLCKLLFALCWHRFIIGARSYCAQSDNFSSAGSFAIIWLLYFFSKYARKLTMKPIFNIEAIA